MTPEDFVLLEIEKNNKWTSIDDLTPSDWFVIMNRYAKKALDLSKELNTHLVMNFSVN